MQLSIIYLWFQFNQTQNDKFRQNPHRLTIDTEKIYTLHLPPRAITKWPPCLPPAKASFLVCGLNAPLYIFRIL